MSTNALANETSPYLLQHKDNPVNWQPWSDQALEQAETEDKPILVSIGYSACHWCHVMEREAFSDQKIAEQMNEYFICIKVDREERPDIDAIYIDAAQMMNGQAGWPLNVFLTPQQVPFFSGTYFPPTPRYGQPSWGQVIDSVHEAWQYRRDEIDSACNQIVQRFEARNKVVQDVQTNTVSLEQIEEAANELLTGFDQINGGFGQAPKFPQAPVLQLLLLLGKEKQTTFTLQQMIKGAMYDQIGGGFARYSVDAEWQIPHFEKMLYDNALLARTYLHGWQLTKDDSFKAICCETLDWVLAEMQSPEGGFYSALDADSEGVEGLFYTWTTEELEAALKDQDLIDQAKQYFGVTEEGNFEGRSALLRRGQAPKSLPEIKQLLLKARSKRVRPALDTKQLTGWSALMVTALAECGWALKKPEYLATARKCAEFLLTTMRKTDGSLLRSYSQGKASIDGFLDDYAYLLEALVKLYECTFEPRWLKEATNLADQIADRFFDPDRGELLFTSTHHQKLVTQPRELNDLPVPSGSAVAAHSLLRLSTLTGNSDYEATALAHIDSHAQAAVNYPASFAHLLQALLLSKRPLDQVVFIGESENLQDPLRRSFHPTVVTVGGQQISPLQSDKKSLNGSPTAYVCEGTLCHEPVTSESELSALLAKVIGD